MSAPRIYFDVTSLARWTGPPVGIVRAQQHLATYARRCRDDVTFTLFDPDRGCWRTLAPDWVDAVLRREVVVEMSLMRTPAGGKHPAIDALPAGVRSFYYWLTKFRRKALFLAEDMRIGATSTAVRGRAERIVDRLMKQREREFFFDQHEKRRACPRFERVAGQPVSLQPHDTTIAAQFDWAHTDIRAIATQKQRIGFRHLVLCYDIIPIVFPDWYFSHDVRAFTSYYQMALPAADCVVVNSRRTAEDLNSYCLREGLRQPTTRVVPLGADPPKPRGTATSLPTPLMPGRFALYVSTIEPRKNHEMLVRVWRRLLCDGVPQRHNFSLVFVGRPGWKMEDFLPRIRGDQSLAATIQILHGIDDSLLAQLYHDAAFCLYPSIYEGFGLPAAEALAYGRPLLASSGGSIPEAVGGAAPCLDPHDEEAWYDHLKRWIENPHARTDAPSSSPAPLTWDEAAKAFFAVVEQLATGRLVQTRLDQEAA